MKKLKFFEKLKKSEKLKLFWKFENSENFEDFKKLKKVNNKKTAAISNAYLILTLK